MEEKVKIETQPKKEFLTWRKILATFLISLIVIGGELLYFHNRDSGFSEKVNDYPNKPIELLLKYGSGSWLSLGEYDLEPFENEVKYTYSLEYKKGTLVLNKNLNNTFLKNYNKQLSGEEYYSYMSNPEKNQGFKLEKVILEKVFGYKDGDILTEKERKSLIEDIVYFSHTSFEYQMRDPTNKDFLTKENDNRFKTPAEVVYTGSGLCKDFAFMQYSLLTNIGEDIRIVRLHAKKEYEIGHDIIAIKGDFEGNYIEVNGAKYFLADSTSDNNIGDVSYRGGYLDFSEVKVIDPQTGELFTTSIKNTPERKKSLKEEVADYKKRVERVVKLSPDITPKEAEELEGSIEQLKNQEEGLNQSLKKARELKKKAKNPEDKKELQQLENEIVNILEGNN